MKPFSLASSDFLTPPRLASPWQLSGGRPMSGRSHSSARLPRPEHDKDALRLSRTTDELDGGLSVGLFALTLPAVGYALWQLWHLVGGETLARAVQAFAP